MNEGYRPCRYSNARDCRTKSRMAQQQKQIETLRVGLKKVTAHFEMTKANPKVVLNNP